MTSIGPPSLLHDIGEQADVAGALDRTGQLALLLGGHRGDPRRDDLAALRQVTLKQADVLEIDDRRVLRAEGAGLAAAEKGSCHVLRSLRSEEHTSELQSLMRTSYAVFCLKKKNKNNGCNIHKQV